MLKSNYIASPLNYIGGKYKLLPQIMPLFPQKTNTFIDYFCGGCNVGINSVAKKVVFNDNLLYLIDLYNAFKSIPDEKIIEHIEDRISELGLSLTNQEAYLTLRELYNEKRNPLDLFVLVAYSFNHQIRFNNSHQFNNPFGKERSCYNVRMKKNLLDFLQAIKSRDVEFSSKKFDEFDFSNLTENDFVYADPPYLITTGTYNDGKRGFTGWNNTEEEKLLDILKSLNERNIKFALSNVIFHKGKYNEILQKWVNENSFIINYISKDYSNCNYHSLNKNKNESVEVLITNYEPEFVLL